MSNYVRYTGETNRGPSPIIWGDIAKVHHDMLMGKCILFYDDFVAQTPLASASASGGYPSYQDTGVTIDNAETLVDLGSGGGLGELEIANNDADNDEGVVFFGGNIGNFRIDNGSGNTGKVMFEARFETATIADNGQAFAIGLGTGPVAQNTLVDDDGTIATGIGFIGFRRLQDDGDQMDIVYQAAGQALQTVEANALTLVANTYYKVGFVYDPTADDAKKVVFYIDTADSGSYVTTTNIDAATFPEGEALCPLIATKVGTASEAAFRCDWIAAAQYGDGEE